MKRLHLTLSTTIRSLLIAACLASCSGGGGAGAAPGTDSSAPPASAPAASAPTPAASDPGSSTSLAMRNITSLQLSKEMSPGWNLGNSLEAINTNTPYVWGSTNFNETAWGNPMANQAIFDAVKAAGFKTVRIPLAWSQYADSNDNVSPQWMARVKQVVDYARNSGLYVVINIHWDGGWMNHPTYDQQPTINARITKFWTQIGNTFKDYDDHLLFAGTNEVGMDAPWGTPIKAEWFDVQNGFNQAFVNAVRATGGNNPKRHLIVQAYFTGIDSAISGNKMPSDSIANRLFMEVHFYDPSDLTINGSSAIWQWGAGATDPNAVETWANEAWVDAQFQKMKTGFVDKGVPVLMGEYAVMLKSEYDAAGTYRNAWAHYVTHSAVAHGVVPVWWDNGYTDNHQMGLFKRTTGAQAFPDLITAIVGAAK